MRALTRAGWGLTGAAVALLAAGRLLGLPELYVLGAAAVAALLVSVVLVSRPLPTVDVERNLRPRRIHLGDQCRVELSLVNAGSRRTPVLTLVDPVEGTSGAVVALSPLEAGERRMAGYRLPTERRGVVRVGPLTAVRTDPLGLARRRHPLEQAADVTILPAVEALGGGVPGGGHDDPLAGAARPASGRSGDEEFAALRPYVVGDDLRRIHWPTSARTGELAVREDDPLWQGHLTVLLDARADRIGPEQFEVAVSAAASVLNVVAERGDRARLLMTDGTDTGPTDARSSRDLLLEHLAVVERHAGLTLPEPPLDGRASTGGLVVVTGRVDPEETARLAHLRHRYATTLVVLVAGSDHDAAGAAPAPGLALVVLRPGVPFAAAWSSSRPVAGVAR